MDIIQQAQFFIDAYNLLIDNDKLNEKDKTELISVMIDYGKILIQDMGGDPYSYIPGESLEEHPYDPGIPYDQPSKKWDLEKADSFEVALARRNQLLKELGLEEDRKDLELEPQSNEEPLDQTFPCDLESLSTPLQVEGSHHIDPISTLEIEELPLDHLDGPHSLEIEICEPNTLSLEDVEMENLNPLDPCASYLDSTFSPISDHVQNSIMGETCIGKNLSFHPSHPSSPSDFFTSLDSYPYMEDYIHPIDAWIEDACTCHCLPWYLFLIPSYESCLDFEVSSSLSFIKHNVRFINLFLKWLHFIFDFT